MNLKRLYEDDDDGNPQVVGVEVLSLGSTPNQHFSTDLVVSAIAQGWMVPSAGKLTLKGANMTVPYKLLRKPGYYCCHCKAALDSGTGKAHVEAEHDGELSPDPANPSGYEMINYYDCVEINPRKGD